VNQAEYQRLRRQLDEELRAGMEMLQAGHRAKVEALDAQGQEDSGPHPASRPVPPEPREEPPLPSAVPPAERERLQAGELLDDIEAARAGFPFLGETFPRALERPPSDRGHFPPPGASFPSRPGTLPRADIPVG
jgi:hypothetical protein